LSGYLASDAALLVAVWSTDDAPLRESLARIWDRFDPMPGDLIDNILVALAVDDLDVTYELLALTQGATPVLGARGAADAFTITFASADLTMVVRVDPTGPQTCRVDGWVTPAQDLTVTATQGGTSISAHTLDGGRFEFPELRVGGTRFLVHPPESTTNLITPAVDL
jgi:hypothetical protein